MAKRGLWPAGLRENSTTKADGTTGQTVVEGGDSRGGFIRDQTEGGGGVFYEDANDEIF